MENNLLDGGCNSTAEASKTNDNHQSDKCKRKGEIVRYLLYSWLTNIHQPIFLPPISAPLMKIKTYLSALRPWSLSASLVPTLLGAAIAYRTNGFHEFNFLTFLFTIFTVVTVHCAGNVVNTYFDFVKGIDNRKSDDRTLVDHILSKDEVRSNVLPYHAYWELHY